MKLGHLRRLLKDYSDECELCVEMIVPQESVTMATTDSFWSVHGRDPETVLVRGEVVEKDWIHCGGSSKNILNPTTAVIEVTFNHFDVTVKQKGL